MFGLRALGFLFSKNGAAGEIARADGIIQSLSRDGIHKPTCVTNGDPAMTGEPIVAPATRFQSRQHMAVEAGILPAHALFFHVAFEAAAETLRRFTFPADPD